MARERHASLLANPVAVELGLEEPNGPSVVLGQMMEDLHPHSHSHSSSTAGMNGERQGGGQGQDGEGQDGEGEEPNILYVYFLDACEKTFANEVDQATFEEHMRWFFRTKVRLLSPSVSHSPVPHSAVLPVSESLFFAPHIHTPHP